MKIIACGCSFMAIDNRLPGTHFTEILAKSLNADLESYAKFGSTNFTVRLQIEEAIKQRPDLILLGFTNVDRLDLSYRPYSIENGIKNIEYKSKFVKPNLPSFYDSELVTTRSEPIVDFEDTVNLKQWLSEIYDDQLKRHSDYFISTGALDKIKKNHIPFVFTRGALHGMNWAEFGKNEVNYKRGCPWHFVAPSGSKEPASEIYHTTVYKQSELAEIWLDKILELYTFS